MVDCTLGGAGHAEAILNLISPEGVLLGIDRDNAAINAAKIRLARFSQQVKLVKSNFTEVDEILEQNDVAVVDGFLFDLGLSSSQVDNPDRGFSYKVDSRLDMRMDCSQGITAADIVNSYSQAKLARVISSYAQEQWASRIAKFIVQARQRQRIETTGQLVEVIKQAIPASARRKGGHPARKTFQALRIETNNELENLRIALSKVVKWLRVGGRLVVISYHSLEDRIIKSEFRQLALGCTCPPSLPTCICNQKAIVKILTPKVVKPSRDEINANPRARSARLRAVEKL
jgi:16S rRNA (cytosine1402-N4)-methyltransferase